MTVRSRTSAVAVLAVALLAGVLSLLPTPAAAATTPFISELHYDDSTGAGDVGESVEVQADPGTDLTGWKIYLYNGGTGGTQGKTYDNDPLPTPVPTAGVVVVSYPTNGVQNGSPDGIALVDDLGAVVEFVSYEGTFAATDGPANGMTSVDIGVAETNSTAPGTSLQKIDGAWTGSATSSFGAVNVADEPEEPEPGICTGTGFTHTIAEVQGTGAATPVPGAVKVTGVVTADHSTGGYNGIYVQTAGSGGATRTVAAGTASDATFVYFGTNTAAFPDVAIGDVVEVTGTATEFSGMTQITTAAASDTAVCSSGATLPEPVSLTFPLADDARESVEGMLVTPTGPVTVSDIYNTNRYGEITLAAGTEPAPIPTDLYAPGTPEALAQKAANVGNRFLLDDGRTTNLSTAGLLPSYLTAADPLRVGDGVAAWGSTVLGYGFNEWRLQPTVPFDGNTAPTSVTTFDTVGRPAAPAEVGGDIKVASFNVLNFFVNYGGDARGADNATAKDKQKAKIVSAITSLDADVVALEEIENSVRFPNGGQAALVELVGALNAVDGAGTWDYVRTPSQLPPPASQDVITTAIIFKPASVDPVGDSVSVNDESVWFNAREPIAQTFSAGDATFTVIANHLKSKSNSTPPQSGNDNTDIGDGQGAFNGDRVRQATALVAFAEGIKTSSGSDDVIMFGDFNAYGQEDPMQVFYDAGYIDVNTQEDTGKHSYVFGGEEGSLDHGLASGSFAERVTGADIWEINAHESFAFQYDGLASFYDDGPYRSSDHNPEVIGVETSDVPAETVDLQLLTINDFHGRLVSPGSTAATATPPNAPIGGAAQLAGLIDQLRAANPNTSFVAAGDNIGASTFVSGIQDDNPTLDTLDAMGLDVSSVGNHEFDKGIADLTDRVEPRADFPYLAANVLLDGEPVLDPYLVKDLGGVDVGYIGVVTEQLLSLVSPGGMAGVTVTDPIEAAEAVAADLKDGDPANGEADVIVLLAHEGADAANAGSVAALEADPVFGEFMDLSDDVDVIVSGHTHIPFAYVATKPNGDPRPVIEAEEYGKKLGKVTLTVDPSTGAITNPAAELIDVVGKPIDQDIKTMVDGYVATANTLGQVQVGTVTADIKRAYVAGSTTSDDRGKESVMGNFIADVQLAGTAPADKGGAEIAFMNAGGLRKDILFAPDGVVTYSELYDVQPFANDLVTKTYTGAQIKAALEQQWQPAGASRPVLWLGVSEGFTYTYDPAKPQGSRINASSMMLNGTAIDPAGTYRVAINGFLATGGDNFAALAGGTDRLATGDNDLIVLRKYFEENSPVTADTAPRTSVEVLPPDDVEVQLLTINDFHGRLVSPGNTAATATPPNAPIGGAAQLAGLIDQLRAVNPNTSFVAAGDNIGASTFVSGIQDDNPTLDTLDAMGLDVSSVGNHEFDKGIADLTDRVEPRADFPYLGANVFLNGQPALDPYVVQDVGGVKVGYIGVVTEQLLSLVSPGGMVGVTVTDPVAAAEDVAADLSDGDEANGEADVVVLLAHEGADAANAGSVAALEADPVFGEFMDLSDDVDVIVSGHTHIPFAYVATKPNGDPRPVIEAEEYGKKLGKVTLTIDGTTGEIETPTAELIDVVGKPIDPDIKTMVDGYVATANTLGQVQVGTVTADIKRAYVAGSTTSDDRGKESVMGNFIADVQLDGTEAPEKGGAQIAFMNAGGLRKDILFAPDGKVTYSELYDVQPFANDIVTKTYTGAQIKAALEQQWQPAGASRPVLWLGVSKGFTYTYDPAQPQGSRVVASTMKLDGITISPTGTYRVAMNGFLATGGDNFAALAGGTDRLATGDNDLIVLKKYFEENSPVTADTVKRTKATTLDYGPFDTVQEQVTQQYQDLAGRAPNALELAAWSAAIENETRTIEQLVVQLLTVDKTSAEARVIRIYDAFFKRPPDPSGFSYWVRQLTSGKGTIRVAQSFVTSSEFKTTYGSLSNSAFVDLVYTNVLERPADASGRTYWINQLTTGRQSRGQMMASFSESSENVRRTVVHLKVTQLYLDLLDRLPSKAESYPQITGIRDGSLTLEDVAVAILVSPAYGARFS